MFLFHIKLNGGKKCIVIILITRLVLLAREKLTFCIYVHGLTGQQQYVIFHFVQFINLMHQFFSII